MKGNNRKGFIQIAVAITAITCTHPAVAVDSTVLNPINLPSAVQPYLLEHGEAMTAVGNYNVTINTIKQRCQAGTKPELITNITGVEWFGFSQAIEGVVNTLVLDTETYIISGQLRAPVNIKGRRPNGASVNWQVWCRPDSTQTA